MAPSYIPTPKHHSCSFSHTYYTISNPCFHYGKAQGFVIKGENVYLGFYKNNFKMTFSVRGFHKEKNNYLRGYIPVMQCIASL